MIVVYGLLGLFTWQGHQVDKKDAQTGSPVTSIVQNTEFRSDSSERPQWRSTFWQIRGDLSDCALVPPQPNAI